MNALFLGDRGKSEKIGEGGQKDGWQDREEADEEIVSGKFRTGPVENE